jgi:hypothetical protein
MDDNRGDLYEENRPVLLFGSKDESHAMQRPCRFAPNRHVLPQDACHKRFSAAYVSALAQECDTLLCVGREKHFKLFFDLITSDPTFSGRINELCVLGKKGASLSQLCQLSPVRKLSSVAIAVILGREGALTLAEPEAFASSSRITSGLAPRSRRSREASELSTLKRPSRRCSVSTRRWASLSDSSPARFRTLLHSSVRGISTEVEMRSRRRIFLSMSVRISAATIFSPENLLTSHGSSRKSPSNKCSVSMWGLPY